MPFSYLPPEARTCVRGTIDCLVVDSAGRLTILEFKTGQPRPDHQVQVDLYARAVEAMFGRGPVEARLCYP